MIYKDGAWRHNGRTYPTVRAALEAEVPAAAQNTGIREITMKEQLPGRAPRVWTVRIGDFRRSHWSLTLYPDEIAYYITIRAKSEQEARQLKADATRELWGESPPVPEKGGVTDVHDRPF